MIGSSLCRLGRRLIPVHRPMNMVLQRRYSAAAAREETRDQEEEQEEMFDQRKLPADYDPVNFDPAEHRSPPSARVWRLVDEISGLTLAEVAELSGIIMRKLNMKEPPVIGVMKGGDGGGTGVAAAKGAAGKEEKKPEKSVFELKLESFDAASKIKVIKEVRGFTDLGLKEAKELVEKAPVVIKGGLTREEAEQIIGKMNAAGAKVVME